MAEELFPGCRLIELSNRGFGIDIEGCQDVPFAIKRVSYFYGMNAESFHSAYAHRSMSELVMAVAGGCTFQLNSGGKTTSVRLDNPTVGLIISPMVWHEMTQVTADCVLVCLSDAAEDAEGYLWDLHEYRTAAQRPL